MFKASKSNMANVRVTMLARDCALVTYTRLIQRLSIDNGAFPETFVNEESRIWKLIENNWQNIHFHVRPMYLHFYYHY
jgi:hypothetical protein